MNAIVLSSAALLAALAAAQLFLASAFSRRIAARVARIRAGRAASGGADLPAPVRDFALRCGAASGGRAARFTQAADLRLKPGAPFQAILATQHVALGEAGFAWDAVRPIGPLPLFRVIDAYDGTGGLLEARFLGAVPLAARSGQDIALGEALRYLAELPWAPDAILGNPDIGWRMTDATHVEASLPVGNAMARVTFSLDAQGDFVTVEAKDRPAFDAQGRAVAYDWRGHFRDYRRIGDRRVPERGEVGYVYPEGYEVYFRGRILSYEVLA
ncbi:DUF6544 family protein [Albidovulum sediminicola]|uniref:DUF4178 domain-containing protein n=1 Tax=Albidovulum sediminicola TaxID=2984331 RepID=A0ABT2Z564_9RHOB|nr:DUF6544 family protein [Defluviimonas sp. WL0075]MCV2866170.1 hypothetical protein [Defluviimonas sp. WL0075]